MKRVAAPDRLADPVAGILGRSGVRLRDGRAGTQRRHRMKRTRSNDLDCPAAGPAATMQEPIGVEGSDA